MKIFIMLVLVVLISCSTANQKPFIQQKQLLEFFTDSDYLVIYVLINSKANRFSNNDYQKVIRDFQNKIWNEKKNEYERLKKNYTDQKQLNYLKFKNSENQFVELINFAKTTEEFQIIERQNEIYKKEIEIIWRNNFTKTQNIVEEITGLKLNKTNNVMITHPGIKNGREFQGQWIEWGGYAEPNFVLTYLWHELLHNYFDHSNLSHAIIELVVDQELYSKLTNTNYPPYRGHRQLQSIEACLLEDWKCYLTKPTKNIFDFLHEKQTMACGDLFKDTNW